LKDSFYFEVVKVVISKGIYFTKRGCSIDFYSTTQDIISLLGRPESIFYKEEDKMKIHSGGSFSGTQCMDYFYNYFHLGIDLLFDIRTHTVKKIILHTNSPCHYEFNMYTKCNFTVYVNELEPADDKPKSNQNEILNEVKSNNIISGRQGDEKSQKRQSRKPLDEESNSDSEDQNEDQYEEDQNDEHTDKNQQKLKEVRVSSVNMKGEFKRAAENNPITPDMKWEQIAQLLPEPATEPVFSNKGTGESFGRTNPFGVTSFYGYKDIIFEIMKNGHIASICLFRD